MEITWLGYSCFRLKGKNITIITDPYSSDLGYASIKSSADIVTVSHNHPNHSNITAIIGQPRVISRPGEYEIGEALVIGISTFHDSQNGATLGKNTVYAIEVDDITICHLGDLGYPLSSNQKEELGNIDILLVPVGGGTTISASQAAALIRNIEPKVVIPMHYRTPTLTKELDPVDKFLKEMGLTEVIPQSKLTLSRANLPSTLQVMILSC